MYYLDLVGAGSGYYYGNGAYNSSQIAHSQSPIYYGAEDVLRAWSDDNADVYWIYGLIRDEPDNRALDQMICDELGIEPSDFNDENIHLLEVAASIWSEKHPAAYLYYCEEKIENKKLKKNIAKKLLDNTEANLVFEEWEGTLSPVSFLYYAMRLILEEEDND